MWCSIYYYALYILLDIIYFLLSMALQMRKREKNIKEKSCMCVSFSLGFNTYKYSHVFFNMFTFLAPC